MASQPPIRVPFTKDYVYLPALEIIFKGAFVGKTFYYIMREWFMEHGYVDLVGEQLLYFVERIYVEKRFGDREIRSRWRVKKDRHETALSGFSAWYIDVDMRMVGLHDEEMLVEGRKIKVLKGEIRIEVRGHLHTEAGGLSNFGSHWFLRNINAFFQKRIYKQELEMQRKELYRDVYRFYHVCKQFFELKLTWAPETVNYHQRFEHA